MAAKGERIQKPWGSETIEFISDDLVVKTLNIEAGERTSLQYHEQKTEVIFVDHGTLTLQLGDLHTKIAGGYVVVKPGQEHRLSAPDGVVRLIEVSTNHLDDVVRVADDYNRA